MKKRRPKSLECQRAREKYLCQKRRSRRKWLKSRRRSALLMPKAVSIVSVPSAVGLFSNHVSRDVLIAFLANLRKEVERVGRSGGTVIVDFGNTLSLEARGMILLYAEIHRLKHYFSTVRLLVKEARQSPNEAKGDAHRKMIVNEVLDHLGLLRQFGCLKRFPSSRNNVVNWQHFHLDTVNMESVLPILQKLETHITQQSSSSLESGLAETVDNAVGHAYSSIRQDGLNIDDAAHGNRIWHLFTHIRESTVSVLLADLGVGIPHTLPQKNPAWVDVRDRLIQRIGGRLSEDGNAIKFAFKHGNSRTGLSHRGSGLPHLVQTIENVPGARLTILSNFGAYNFDKGQWTVLPDARTSILGTLITWGFPLTPPTLPYSEPTAHDTD